MLFIKSSCRLSVEQTLLNLKKGVQLSSEVPGTIQTPRSSFEAEAGMRLHCHIFCQILLTLKAAAHWQKLRTIKQGTRRCFSLKRK